MIRANSYPRSKTLAHGGFYRLGTDAAYLSITTDDEPYTESVRHETHRHALRGLIDWLHRNRHIATLKDIKAVIYVLPHGGTVFRRTTLLRRDDLHDVRRIAHLTPDMHGCVATVESGMRLLTGAKHIAVFDTAFFSQMPHEAATYALPAQLRKSYGLRRYGAHGIIHKAAYEEALAVIAQRSRGGKRKALPRRIVSVHVDEETSVVAILDGVAVETTTGFTSGEGLPGLLQAGSIDSRIPLHLSHRLGATPHAIDDLLTRKSGLLGLTGKKDHAQILSGAKKNDKDCVAALMLFSYRIAQSIAGMIASLEGSPQLIVFSGTGASWVVREEVCRRLQSLGVRLGNHEKRVTGVLSNPKSAIAVVAVSVDAEDAVLRDASRFIPLGASRNA